MSALDPVLWRRVEAAFDALLDLDGDARAAELARLAAHEPALHGHVAALLRADGRAGGPLDASAAALVDPLVAAAAAAIPAETAPPLVAGYRIGHELGRGGMGVVYLAERADGSYEQTVALKVLRPGTDTEGITQRFLLERRILARLEHPGIARLLDGGVTADGRPYFVMEHVDGMPITDFADAQRLDVRERVALFAGVCAAVAFAQRHLIVHRDLKPSNILVTAAGEVKLLDFGIAKPLDTWGSAPADLTRTGSYPLTPAYASPEQLRREPVTTASDVYALGMVLYELLSGRRAQREARIVPGRLDAALLDQDPAPISRAVAGDTASAGGSGAEAQEIAQARRVSVGVLRRQLRGDLERIVAMAIRREPERRYASAADLLEDLENFRAGRPVVARGDSVAYRTRSFLRRHRLGVAAVAVVVLALAAGLAGTSWQAGEASRQAARAHQVKEFLAGLFVGADPDAAPGRELSAADLLERGAERIDAELGTEPGLQAELLQLVGNLQVKLGRYAAARPLLTRAVALRTAVYGAQHRLTGDVLADLGVVAVHEAEYAEADSLLRLSLALERRAGGGPRAEEARRLNDLGVVRARLGDPAGAEAYYREALAIDRRVLGDEHLEVASDLDNIAVVLVVQDRLDEAVALHREALAIRRRLLPPDHSKIGTGLHNLAFALREAGDTAAADSLGREAVALRRRLYPGGHPDLAISLKGLAQIEFGRGNFGAADSLLAEALAINLRLLGPEHEQVAALLNEQGMVAFGRGDHQACERHFEEALAIWAAILPPGHPTVMSVRNNLAWALRANGKYKQAERHCRDLLAARIASLGADHPQVAYDRLSLGIVLRLDGRPAEALAELERGLALRQADPACAPVEVAHARFHLGAGLAEAGRPAEAEGLLRAAESVYVVELAPDAPRLAEARCALGSCLLELGRRGEAEPLLAAGLGALGTDLGRRDPVARRARADLAALRDGSR